MFQTPVLYSWIPPQEIQKVKSENRRLYQINILWERKKGNA